MKKILAVLLCLVCLISSTGATASAAFLDDMLTNITVGMGLEPDEPIIYGITYASSKILSGVSVMYMPSTTFKFTNPGTYTVTHDRPLSIDYEFICWEDEDTGKYYYGGEKIYIDGQKTFYAIWEPKTDNNPRFLRTLITAVEALRRTLQAFFGFYKMEFEEDPTEDIEETDLFDIEELISYEYYYGVDKRHIKIAVEPCAEGVVYESFSKNDKILFGGDFEKVELRDDEGNKYIEEQFRGATEYSAHYEMTSDIYVTKKGTKYQLIDVTLTDGVPDPVTGIYITLILPRGFLRYKDANGEYQTNKTYAFTIMTTKTISTNEENRFHLNNLLESEYDLTADNKSFNVLVEHPATGIVFDKIENGECQVYVDDIAYLAEYKMSTTVKEKNGMKYQTMEVSFKDTETDAMLYDGADVKLIIPGDAITFSYDGVTKKSFTYTFNFEA